MVWGSVNGDGNDYPYGYHLLPLDVARASAWQVTRNLPIHLPCRARRSRWPAGSSTVVAPQPPTTTFPAATDRNVFLRPLLLTKSSLVRAAST